MPNLQGLRLSRRDSCLHWEPGLGPWKKVCHNRYDNTIQVPHTEEAPPTFTSEVTSPCSFKQLLRNNAQHLEVRVQTLVPPPAPVCLHLSQAVSHCFPGLQGCPKRRVSMLLFLPSLPSKSLLIAGTTSNILNLITQRSVLRQLDSQLFYLSIYI